MSDVSASSVYQTLLNEINRGNGLQLQLNQVSFGIPELLNAGVTDLSHPTLRNSRVKVTAGQPGNGYVEVMANYNRLSLSKLFALGGVTLPLIPNGALVDYLPGLNAKLNTTLTLGDLQPVTVGEGSVLLSAHPNSLYVIGEASMTVGVTVPSEARIELVMAGFDTLYAIAPDGTRGALEAKPGGLGGFIQPEDLDGYTFLSRPNANIQMSARLVDANGPLPEDQQPVFQFDLAQFNQPQVLDAASVSAAMAQYIELGLGLPEWYSPGCYFSMFGLNQWTNQQARATVTAVGRSDVAPVSFAWRLPQLTATAHVTGMSQPALKLAPASTLPSGELKMRFPDPNRSQDFYADDALLLPGSEITGGVLRGVDWCQNFNTPTSSLNCKIEFTGVVTECEDIPEWVGVAVGSVNTTFYLTHACTLDKVPDLTTLQFDETQWNQKRNVFIDLTFPGTQTDVDYRQNFDFTMIQGLQFELLPYEGLPNNNGETPI